MRTTLLTSVEDASSCGGPPGLTMLTDQPRESSSSAAVQPKMPPPTMTTRLPV